MTPVELTIEPRIQGTDSAAGHKRGVYCHPAVPPEQRETVIQNWYDRRGLPRYERTKNLQPPYQNGRDDLERAA